MNWFPASLRWRTLIVLVAALVLSQAAAVWLLLLRQSIVATLVGAVLGAILVNAAEKAGTKMKDVAKDVKAEVKEGKDNVTGRKPGTDK